MDGFDVSVMFYLIFSHKFFGYTICFQSCFFGKCLFLQAHSAVFPYSYTFLDEAKDTSLGEFHLHFA